MDNNAVKVEKSGSMQRSMSRHSTEAEIIPTGWERFLGGEIACGCCGFCTSFWVIFLLNVIALAGFKFNTREEGSWSVLTDVRVQRHFAREEIMEKTNYFTDARRLQEENAPLENHAPHTAMDLLDSALPPIPRRPTTAIRNLMPNSGNPASTQSQSPGRRMETRSSQHERKAVGGATSIIYEATGTNCPKGGDCNLQSKNVLKDNYLNAIKKFEKKLLDDPDFKTKYCMLQYADDGTATRCTPPQTVLQMLFFSEDSTSPNGVRTLLEEGFGNDNAPPKQCMCSGSISATTNKCTIGSTPLLPVSTCAACADKAAAVTCASSSSNATAYVDSFCASHASDSCEYAPPLAGLPCSSNAWSYIDFGSSPVPKATKDDWYCRLCSGDSSLSWLTDLYFPNFACSGKGQQLIDSGTPFARSVILFGAPAKNTGTPFPRTWDDEEESDYLKDSYSTKHLELYLDAMAQLEEDTDGEVRALPVSALTAEQEIQYLLNNDSTFAMMSFILVFIFMWFVVESCFITSFGMLQVIFSFPIAVLLWSFFPNGAAGVGFMQFLCLFMILGIGADDVFVFFDAWKQARVEMGKEAEPIKVFATAYRRAFSAMAATTFTTCCAFVFGAFIEIKAVSDFCVFASFVVGFDFIWCITLTCSACAAYDRYVAGHMCFKCTPETTPGSCCQPGCCFGCVRIVWRKITGSPADSTTDVRYIEKFIEEKLFPFISKFKIHLIVFWGVFTVAMIIVAATCLKMEQGFPNIGDQNNHLVRFLTISQDYFTSSDEPSEVFVMWGLDDEMPVEKWETNPLAPVVKWKTDYAAGAISADGQQKILALCQAPDAAGKRCLNDDCLIKGTVGNCARDTTCTNCDKIFVPQDVLCTTGRYCLMEQVHEFATSWSNPPKPWPLPDFMATVGSAEYREYTNARDEAYRTKGMHWEIDNGQSKTGLHTTRDGKPGFMFVTFNGTFPAFVGPEIAGDLYDKWQDFVDQHASGTGAVQTAMFHDMMVLMDKLVQASITGIIISVLVALGALALITWNWYIAFLGFLNIVIILICFLGFMPILGLELGIYECLFLIMTVGLSVDYTVHLLHAYNESPEIEREARAKASLGSMGITVLSGAATTLFAALSLFFCLLSFFKKYGLFVFFTILFSIFLAVFNLTPLLILIGPSGPAPGSVHCFGDIIPFYKASAFLKAKLGGKPAEPLTKIVPVGES